MSITTAPSTPHERAECYQVMGTQHYNRSWSYEFMCQICGRRGRFNTSFLGHRNTVFCDGTRFERAPKGIGRARLKLPADPDRYKV